MKEVRCLILEESDFFKIDKKDIGSVRDVKSMRMADVVLDPDGKVIKNRYGPVTRD